MARLEDIEIHTGEPDFAKEDGAREDTFPGGRVIGFANLALLLVIAALLCWGII